jgi:hypothetical protein
MSHDRMDTEEFAAMVAAPLKAKVPLSADFEAKLMTAVAEAARPWWQRRVQLSVTPLTGLALAAGFAGLMVLAGVGVGSRMAAPQAVVAATSAAAPAADTVHLVRFVIALPEARTVTLAGDFNGWSRNATPLEDVDGRGQWTVTLPLAPGRHEYAFVVDGERWMPDPFATVARDEFGQESSVVRVGADPSRGA